MTRIRVMLAHRCRSARVWLVALVTAAAIGGVTAVHTQTLVPPFIRMLDLGRPNLFTAVTAISNHGQIIGSSYNSGSSVVAFSWTQAGGFVRLGTVGGYSRAAAVNDVGQVVGSGTHAFLWTATGGLRDLGTLAGGGSGLSAASDINNLGQVVGSSATADGGARAFIWTAESGMADLGTLGGRLSEAIAINQVGQIIGTSQTATGDSHAFLWTAIGGMIDLGTLGGSSSAARAINDAGEIVGSSTTPAGVSHAFLWTAADGMRDLGTLGGDTSVPADLNDAGQVIGSSQLASGASRAFSWTAATGMIDLGTLGSDTSAALSLNDAGHVVGNSAISSGASRAFWWTAATGMVDLGTLNGATSAVEINNQGQIAGLSEPVCCSILNVVLWEELAEPDTTPPVVTVPAPFTMNAPDAGGATAFFAASAFDAGDQKVPPVSCTPASGSLFPPGTTIVSCTADDSHGNTGAAAFSVTVARIASVVALGTAATDPESEASDINNAGQVAGKTRRRPFDEVSRAVLWTAGEPIDVGSLGNGQSNGAVAVSDAGRVTAFTNTDNNLPLGFSWTATEGVVALGTLGGRYSLPRAANASDQIVGESEIADGDGTVHGFSWTPTTGMIDLGTLGGTWSYATAVNDAGEVVGYSQTATGSARAFRWTADGGMIDLGALGDGGSRATAISNAGQVVGSSWLAGGGTRAFSWTADTGMIDLGTLGGTLSEATAVNDLGQVVGQSDTATSRYHTFLWTAAGGMSDLGSLGGLASTPRAINNAGQVIGVSGTQAFLWSARTGMIGLGTTGGPFTLGTVAAINDAGQIAGSVAAQSGMRRAVVWQLLPEVHQASQSIPGRIEAEDYDLGGQGEGYFDSTPGNEGGAEVYRADDVDIKASAEGGYAVGWMTAGEWLAYTVDVKRTGLYTFNARVGSLLPGRTFHLEAAGSPLTGPIPVPQLDDWDQYQTIAVPEIFLTAGVQVIRVVVGTDDYLDLQWFEFVLQEDNESGPFTGTPIAIPGLIEPENYDGGGQGVGYFDTTPGNEQGVSVYRSGDVDLKVSGDGYAVGWFVAGEWLAYTVDVAADGVYSIRSLVGSALPGRTFHLEVDQADVTGPVAVPQFDAWDTYGEVQVDDIPLGAGTHILRVVMGPLDYMDFRGLAIAPQ